MKFYALIVLPKEADISRVSEIEEAAALLMKPFKMWEDDVPVGRQHWDWYWCCTKEWLEQSNISFSEYSTALPDHPYLVFPAETLSEEGVVDSVVTPDGEWVRSKSPYTMEDPTWPQKAVSLCNGFSGHYAVLAYCHG
jgi:hypothetical protein